MVDNAFGSLIRSKIEDLELALAVLLEAQAKQVGIKAKFPGAYDENFHAAGIATHIQGIYTQIEGLIKQTLEATDGKIPKSETWHQDLIRLASMAVPGERGPLLNESGSKSMKALLAFRHKVRSNYAGELEPYRVFEHLSNCETAVKSTVAGLRQFFPEIEPPPISRET